MEQNPFAEVRALFEELRNRCGAAAVETEFSFDDPDVRVATDDFSIHSREGKLYFAAGNIRGLFYAVYEYFERYCHCRWFWDGDVIPHRETLPAENIHYCKRFRLPYRGLRYFAHRSLYRFQAEHWGWSDWKKEIDFLLKKHFSFFMLRTGQDDLFQKAFPDVVPYPPEEGPAPEAVMRSYNDRTELISLQYRGQLRKQILQYSHARGLMHPEDMGPMTHWYSHTPKAFLEHYAPPFMNQSSTNYSREETRVWDCDKEECIRYYMELTKAHIRHYGYGELFHIIGLAERVFGSEKENFETKVRVMRSFIRELRKEYPNAPLLIASWDFMFRWKAPEVRRFLKQLDPANTLILDYTTDSLSPGNTFLQWDLPHKFPWIFGIFQAYEPQADLFLDLDRIEELYTVGRTDPQCKGMVVWSENSHSNSLLLEYLAKNMCDETFSLEEFCRDRYGVYAEKMHSLWTLTKKAFSANTWIHGGFYCNHFNLLSILESLGKRVLPEQYGAVLSELTARYKKLEIPAQFFEEAACLAGETDLPELLQRDLADLVRTSLMCRITRELCLQTIHFYDRKILKADFTRLAQLIRIMGDLLSTLEEYSLNHTLERVARNGKLNPHAETTLKNNAENSYCRSYIYELYREIYEPEAEFAAEYFRSLPPGAMPEKEVLTAQQEKIRSAFYEKPLAECRPDPDFTFAEEVQTLKGKLFPETEEV